MEPQPDPPLDEPELAERAEEFRRDARRAEKLAGGLSERQMTWRAGPDRWSVSDCLEHLVRTGEAYFRVLDPVMDEAWEEGRTGEGPFRHGFLDRLLVRFLEPPPRWGIPAPRVVDPRRGQLSGDGSPAGGSGVPTSPGGGDDGSPLPRFLTLQDRLIRRLGRADGLDLSGIRVTSPFFWFVRMDLGTAFALLAAHQRRHLWQAEQVTREEGFPAA